MSFFVALIMIIYITQRLYEDMVKEKITEEIFIKLSQSYEKEQKELNEKIKEIEKYIKSVEDINLNTQAFLKQVREYTDITELTPEIIRVFVDKIAVEESLKEKRSRNRKQTIWIYWNYIGILDIEKSA